MSLLGRAVGFLDSHGVPSALIGGAALAAHGILRATLDADLLVLDRRVLDEATWDPLRAEGLSVTVHRGDLLDPLVGVVRLLLAADAEGHLRAAVERRLAEVPPRLRAAWHALE